MDHPSFGTAVIARVIESEGLNVAIVPQPNWQDDLRDFKKFGKPRLFFGVTSGSMDSMINHYTANKRKRSEDAYTPGGEIGHRPDNAVTVYSEILKKLYPETPIILGGIEASLRRSTYYHYWDDKLKPTILSESGADLLVYGLGEMPILKIVKLLKKGVPFSNLRTLNQIAYLQKSEDSLPKNRNWSDIFLNSHDDCLKSKKYFIKNAKVLDIEAAKQKSSRIIQEVDGQRLIINPPFYNIKEREVDYSFDLPYTRLPHPKYKKRGKISAYEMIKFSVILHHGCFGGCSFCAISAHQGKSVVSRSKKSILKEVDRIVEMPDFKGYISDIGGPSANMYKMEGIKGALCLECSRSSCLFPKVCKNLNTDHGPLSDLYREIRGHKLIKKAFISSGIRYDFAPDNYMEEVIRHHTSGRLKVAPEHTENSVLKWMRKPSFKSYDRVKNILDKINRQNNTKLELIPYFMSNHPGCKLDDMKKLSKKIVDDYGYKLEQVQSFTPTPLTIATAIYYGEVDPYTRQKVYVEKSVKGRKCQHNLFF